MMAVSLPNISTPITEMLSPDNILRDLRVVPEGNKLCFLKQNYLDTEMRTDTTIHTKRVVVWSIMAGCTADMTNIVGLPATLQNTVVAIRLRLPT